MIYGGPPKKPVWPTVLCAERTMGYRGPGVYSYGLLAKEPGSNYRIQLRDYERMRYDRFRLENENNSKSITRHVQHKQMINSSNKKFLYNKIKRMVDSEMKANEHLFVEKCPKQELKVEEKPPEVPKLSEEEIMAKLKEINKKKEEEMQKIVEEKRLQLFINASEEIRLAKTAKITKEISKLNYDIIQEKYKENKEYQKKRIELANLKCLEFHKNQMREKEEERRKKLENRLKFQMDWSEQVQEKNVERKQKEELKILERIYFEEFNEKLNEEQKLVKLECMKAQEEKRKEIEQTVKEREKCLFDPNDVYTSLKMEMMRQNLIDDAEDKIEAKRQAKRESDMLIEYNKMMKEERRRQSEEVSNAMAKQIKEIDDHKLSIELKSVEARRKRNEEAHKFRQAQREERKLLLEQEKETKREAFKESVKNTEIYLEEQRQLCEKRKHDQWQTRIVLGEQVREKKEIIEQQSKINTENYHKSMQELAEKDALLKKLLSEV